MIAGLAAKAKTAVNIVETYPQERGDAIAKMFAKNVYDRQPDMFYHERWRVRERPRPRTTLGCGRGNNSISENLSWRHLFNVSRLARVKPGAVQPPDEEIWS